MNKAIFLDRDGTINVDTHFTHKIEDLKFEEGAIEALKKLKESDYKLIIITSQSGIGRGYYTEEDYQIFMKELEKQSVAFDGTYFCPHHPTEAIGEYLQDCECRKPTPGMLENAAEDHDIDLSQSWSVGDSARDIDMGKTAGCKTILVLTGKGKEERLKTNPDKVVRNLLEATEYILSQ